MKIEKVTSPEQLSELEALAAEIWKKHYIPIIGIDQVRYMLQRFQSREAMSRQIAEGYEYYWLRESGIAIGYFAYRQQPGELFLSKIYLKEEMRGQGKGKYMMNYLIKLAHERGLSAIRLTVNKNNLNSIAAYEKLGFKKVRPVTIIIGSGFVMDDFEMVKEI